MSIADSVRDAFIRINTYNGRAVSHNGLESGQKCFIMNRQGHLFGIAGTSMGDHEIYRSEDDGFSWNIYPEAGRSWLINARVGEDPDGQTMHLFYSEVEDKVYGISTQAGDGDIIRYDAVDDELLEVDLIPFLGDLAAFIGNPDHNMFLIFQDQSDGEPTIARFWLDPLSVAGVAVSATPSGWWTYPIETFDAVTNDEDITDENEDGRIHMAWVIGDFQADSNAPTMAYMDYIKPTTSGGLGSWDTVTKVWRGSGRLADPGIAVDGTKTLAIVCSHNPSGNSDRNGNDLQLFTSYDTGATWASGIVPRPTGTSGYIDLTQGNPISRCSIIGDRVSGFMIGGIFEQNSSSDVYVTEFDGYNWPIASDWKRANSDTDDRVTGYQFFRPNNGTLNDIRNKASLRLAYQIGHGNQETGEDSIQTQIRSERLTNVAFPTGNVNLTTTASHVDYYASGMIGGNTSKYASAFELAQTGFTVYRYEPIENVNITDRGAYTLEDTFIASGFFDPVARSQATRETTIAETDEELFAGTLYLGPSGFLPVNFIRNRGNFVKKTEYIFKYQDKKYSIFSMTPRFLNDEITHWECQTTIIGPTFNPFTRVIYPSEF